MDDVISKTTETYIRIAKEEFGKDVRFEDLNSFDLKASFGLTQNQFHYFFDLVHLPDRLAGYDVVDGAVSVLADWKAQGHIIEIVTGRPTSAKEVTLAWLGEKRVPYDAFIMVDKYNRPGNDLSIAITKTQLSQRHYDLAVEDSMDMALFLAGQMRVTTALIHRPWNLRCPSHDRVVRCQNWHQIQSMLQDRCQGVG